MSKVIVERPRTGRAAGMKPGRTRALVDDDGAPLRAKGAREPVGRDPKTKRLNETLNPLKRYIASNVGRPWNKVFSEISEHLKPTSTVQQHVRDHLDDFVAVKTRMKSGKVVASGRWRGGDFTLDQDHRKFYVHPRTGLLRRNEAHISFAKARKLAREAEAAERATRMRVVNATEQLHLLNDGAWWEVKLARIKYLGAAAAPFTDVIRRAKLSKRGGEDLYGRDGVYACDKRQLSKAEMKRLKLR